MSTAAALADQRDLRFFPVDETRSLRALTREQVRAYNRDGIVHGLTVFTGDEVERNRLDFERLLAAYRERGLDSYAINSAQASCASLYDLATHPRIADLVGDLLGDEFACWGSHYFCKLPGDTKSVSWHQDAPYWPMSPSKTVTVWLAIDDADDGNGAMRVVPGSHLDGPLPTRRSLPEEENVLWLTVDGAEQRGVPQTVALKAGQISLHSDMLLHGSGPNPSTRRRCGLTLRYCTLDVRSSQDWNSRAFLVRGQDPTGYWNQIRSRPDGDRPFDGKPIGAN